MAEPNQDAVALVMAGGSGTRFWPLSLPNYPKQFLKLMGDRTLIQSTCERLAPLFTSQQIAICGIKNHESHFKKQLPEVTQHIFEPFGRNTAACLMLSTHWMLQNGYSEDTVMVALPADHHIGRPDVFRETLASAIAVARKHDALVTLGIQPDRPHTGYGYIAATGKPGKSGELAIERFVEKPDEVTAQRLLNSGKCYWNGGIFVWKLSSIIREFQKHLKTEWDSLTSAHTETALANVYQELPSVPIDKAIMEKSENSFVIPVDMNWSDVGSWDALAKLLETTSQDDNVVLKGLLNSFDSQKCIVSSEGSVSLIGVENLIVISEGGKILIARRDLDQQVKKAAQEDKEPSP